jgi:hypothetical protein
MREYSNRITPNGVELEKFPVGVAAAKQQVSPLRFPFGKRRESPVEMTTLEGHSNCENRSKFVRNLFLETRLCGKGPRGSGGKVTLAARIKEMGFGFVTKSGLGLGFPQFSYGFAAGEREA